MNDFNNISGSNTTESNKLKELKAKAPLVKAQANAYGTQDENKNIDTIQLSNLAKKMPELESKAQNTAEIDIERVEKIQASLAEGSYQVDANALAQKLIQDDQQF